MVTEPSRLRPATKDVSLNFKIKASLDNVWKRVRILEKGERLTTPPPL